MEEILSSIKRIIAEEGDGLAPAARGGRRASRSASRNDDDSDEVLELRDPVDDGVEVDAPAPRARAKPAEAPRPAPRDKRDEGDTRIAATKAEFETMLSERAAEASRGQLEALSRLIVKPAAPTPGVGSETLEGLVREMLRPMLSEWLDANLPQIVETMVAREIARITNRDD